MAENSAIQWTHHTLNPWRGCSKVHAGCTNCYAEVNYSVKMHGVKWGPNGTRVMLSKPGWREPLKWNRDAEAAGERRRVFCASLADVFEDWQGDILDHNGKRLWVDRAHPDTGYIAESAGFSFEHCRPARMDDLRRDLFTLIDSTPNLDWLLLTKRPENVRKFWWPTNPRRDGGLRQNVWLGTSISDQKTADEWVPRLLECRDLSPVLFLSCEPIIGKIELAADGLWDSPCPACIDRPLNDETNCVECRTCDCSGKSGEPWIDWVIVGGESGPHARAAHIEWIRSLVNECNAAHLPVFVKQLGANAKEWDQHADGLGGITGGGGTVPYATASKKGGEPDEWPEDLRVREFPILATVQP